jgi:hypothetical protein
MRASAILFGEEENKVGLARAHPDSGSTASSGSTIHPAVHAFRAAHSIGVRLTLRGEHIEWTAARAPTDDLLTTLRDHKPAIVAILRGDACRSCGERLAWPGPAGIVLGDGTAECMPCADREVWRLLAAAERVVASPNALADPAELMLRPGGLTE